MKKQLLSHSEELALTSSELIQAQSFTSLNTLQTIKTSISLTLKLDMSSQQKDLKKIKETNQPQLPPKTKLDQACLELFKK